MAIPRESFKVKDNGIEMDVLALGQGEPLVLIHGFTASKEAWFFNLEALAARFRVLAMDLPGYGASSKVVESPPLSFYAGWVLRLLDHQGIAAAHVVGNSMGGAVAMELALTQPRRVKKLVLVDSLGMGEPTFGVLDRLVNSNTRQEVEALLGLVVHDPAMVLPQAVDRSFQYRQEPGVPALLKRVAALLTEHAPDPGEIRRRMQALKMPVLVVWGREDRLLPVAHTAAVANIPDARVHIFEKCGHLPQLEHALAFNTLVAQFLLQH
jgi:pyruvate dehydrogenase E2 component (dihydrolipoamide acetyltransferase)